MEQNQGLSSGAPKGREGQSEEARRVPSQKSGPRLLVFRIQYNLQSQQNMLRCNKDLPDLPFPPPLPTEKPTDAPPTPCPGHKTDLITSLNLLFSECTKCYNCGYKQDGLDGEMGEITGVAFCNGRFFFTVSAFHWIFSSSLDFATENTVVSCGMDDCCGMLKEYFIK